MLVIRQKHIYRVDIQANLKILYLFGDNLDRKGMGGQAAEMRGEPNSFGIATKRSITHNYPGDYFFDGEPDVIKIIDREFVDLQEEIVRGRYQAIVIPLDGLGTGLSKMPHYAPKALAYLNVKLQQLEQKDK